MNAFKPVPACFGVRFAVIGIAPKVLRLMTRALQSASVDRLYQRLPQADIDVMRSESGDSAKRHWHLCDQREYLTIF